MTHEELRDRLLDLAYGELPVREAHELEAHATTCEACRAELARIQATRRVMSALPVEPAPEGGERVLLAAAREAVERRRVRGRPPRWLWRGALVAVPVAAVLAVSVRIMDLGPKRREGPDTLMGESPYAARVEAPPPSPPEGERAGGKGSDEQRGTAMKKQAPPPAAAPARARESEQRARDTSEFATPPPGMTAERKATARPHGDESASANAMASPSEPPAEARAENLAPLPAPAPAPAPARPAQPSLGGAAPQAGMAGATDMGRARAAAKAAPGAVRQEMEPGAEAQPGAAGVARYEALRRDGLLHVEEREFPGCSRELSRRIERDPEGRIVSYTWESMAGSQRLRLQAIYAPDGTLADKRAFDAASGEPETFVKWRSKRVSEIDLGAPSACER